ncbi:MAG: hypothetical protein RL732_172 [Bacteroidota bacterium]|jgi:uncharacterized membrane protein YphA (DoxX/SURF4 family)
MKNKVLTALSVLLGLMFINSGLNKFLNYLPVPDGLPEEVVKDNNAIAEIVWLLPLIGSIEIIGGLLIIIPKTRAIGALMILPVMAGIMLSHLLVFPAGLPVASVLLAILLWILYEKRANYLALLN